MLSVILWTSALWFTLHRTNNTLGKIEGKMGIFHGVLLWLFLMTFSTSVKMLGWSLGHIDEIEKYFYIPIGPIPNWLNLTMWLLFLVFGLFATYLSFKLASRKEKFRKIFVKFIPIFYILNVYEFVKSFFINASKENLSLWLAISIGLIIIAIPFGLMLYFYSRESVKEKIFTE
jgi:hypothetical protein